jgi:predicted Zn-dependent peptidase
MLDIMSDVLLNPSFPESEFEKIRKQTISSLTQSRDDASTIAANVAGVLRNGKQHPYGEVMTENSVANLTLDHCRDFYRRCFKPNISYLIVTGDITEAEAMSLANRYFGSWQPGQVDKTDFPAPQPPDNTRVSFVDKSGAVQSVISITYPLDVKPGSEEAIRSSVLNTLLGGYFGSRLMTNLREDKAYTYGARSSMNADPVIGFFNAGASVRNEVTDSAIVQFLLEMEKLRTTEIPAAELDMVKRVMTGSFARSLERPETIARFALNTARFNLPSDYYANYLETLNQVNAAELSDLARRLLLTKRAHILVVGNKDAVADKLAAFSADSTVHFLDVYGAPVPEANLTVPDGVTAETVLQDYLAALGDPALLDNLQRLKIEMSASVQGMTMEMTLFKQTPYQMAVVNSMMGNVMQKSVYNAGQGVHFQMGQQQPMSEEELADMKFESYLIPELGLLKEEVPLELKGMESVNGKPTYKLSVSFPSGSNKLLYFDAATSLKVREVEQRGESTVVNDYSDYRPFDGILFPIAVSISGVAPFPISMTANLVELNGQLAPEIFSIP